MVLFFTFDYGACYSKELTNEDIDSLILFLQKSRVNNNIENTG